MSVTRKKSSSSSVVTKKESQSGDLKGQVIDNRYKLIEVIGKGSFGEIMLARDMKSDEMVAIKLEKIKDTQKKGNLELEYNFYKMVGCSADGYPRIDYFGKYRRYHILVMELLGLTLQSVFNNCGQQFSLKTIIYIFLQILQRIEHLHKSNLIFRDIKPENFLLGREGTPKENVIHIIDFGLTKQFCDPKSGQHIPMTKKRMLTGTCRYMSINSHLGKEQSRRDDLEAIGYMMMYFLRQGKLPWMGLNANSIKERNKKIGLFKRGTPIETLCYGFPEQFADYLRYVRRMDFEEKPNYQFLKSQLIKLFEKERLEDDGYYDWN